MTRPLFPVYRLIRGKLCRQDVPGGDWSELDRDAANDLLRKLDGEKFQKAQSASLERREPIFHHPV